MKTGTCVFLPYLSPYLLRLLLLLVPQFMAAQEDEQMPFGSKLVAGPFGDLHVLFSYQEDSLYLQARYQEKLLMGRSQIGLSLWSSGILVQPQAIDTMIVQQIDSSHRSRYYRRASLHDHAYELRVRFEEPIDLLLRVYDLGFAYRWELRNDNVVHVVDETLAPRLPQDPELWARWSDQAQQSSPQLSFRRRFFEGFHDSVAGPYARLPLLARAHDRARLVIGTLSAHDYPEMMLQPGPSDSLSLTTAWQRQPFPQPIYASNNQRLSAPQPDSLLLAEVAGPRALPWRIFVVAETDQQLLDQDLTRLLSLSEAEGDTLWRQPGAMIGPAWTNWNLEQVDFDLGCNMATYQYYLAFAQSHQIPYLRVDSVWASDSDLTFINPSLDLSILAAEAQAAQVGLWLTCPAEPLMQQLSATLGFLSDWGVAGIVVQGESDRPDWQAELARATKTHRLMLLFEGSAPLDGLSHRYPHVLAAEGSRSQWSNLYEAEGTQPTDHLDALFLRNLMGPSFQPMAAMRHGHRHSYRSRPGVPMAAGTRVQQMALPLLYDMPMRWLADMPTTYAQAPDLLAYWRDLPAYWDQTYVQAGQWGEYAVMARRKGEMTWYIGAVNNWEARSVDIDLSYLPKGFRFEATIFTDGQNADRLGQEWTKEIKAVDQKAELTVNLAPGGGAVVIVRPGL